MQKMDVDQLITAVWKRPSIWDKRLKEHANRILEDKAWKEISKEMNTEDAVLKKKWKNLRDYFGTEFSKRPVGRSGDGAGPSSMSKWQYFNQLLFLEDIVTPRSCAGSLSSLVNDDNDELSQGEDSLHSFQESTNTNPETENVGPELTNLDITDLTDGMVSGATSPTLKPVQAPTPPNAQHTRGKKRKADSFSQYEKLLDLEQQKIKLLTDRTQSNESNDDDLLFLKSLLPFIKRIPEERKMTFRSRVQLLIDEFTYRDHMVTHPLGNRYEQYLEQRPPATSPLPAYRSYHSSSSAHNYQSYDSSA